MRYFVLLSRFHLGVTEQEALDHYHQLYAVDERLTSSLEIQRPGPILTEVPLVSIPAVPKRIHLAGSVSYQN